MNNIDWNDVQAPAGASKRPLPGAYAAVIKSVEDVENKQYLRICWDYAEEPFKGNNEDCHDLNGFWPCRFVKSYKPNALYFFKKFKEAVEASNRKFVFKNDPDSLVGKFMGVVIGEEEYKKNDGTIGTRLYVFDVIPGSDVRSGNFTIPPLKRLEAVKPQANHYGADNMANAVAQIAALNQPAEEEPFAAFVDDALPF